MHQLNKRKTKFVAATGCVYRGRQIVIQVTPTELLIKERYRHKWAKVSWLNVWELAMHLEALEKRRTEIVTKKKARRK